MSTVVNAPNQALRSFSFRGAQVIVHADASDTNGSLAALEMRAVAGHEPPMHIHENEDEIFIVVEGKMKVINGSEECILSAGQSAIVKRGTPHTFQILTRELRTITLFTPAGMEEFFRALAGDAPSFGKMAQVAAQHGSRFVR